MKRARADFIPMSLGVTGPDLWIQSGFGEGSFLDGYTESGRRTHHAPLAGLGAGGSNLHFVEGRDGWLYGVFVDGVGKYKKFKKFKVNPTSISSVILLATLVDQLDFLHPHNPVMVGPDGSIYLRVRSDADPLGLSEPWGSKYKKWDGASLTDVGGVNVAWSNWAHFENQSCACLDCLGEMNINPFTFRVVVHAENVYRRWVPIVLSTGCWVVADPIPGDADISSIQHEGIAGAAACQHMTAGCNDEFPPGSPGNPYGSGNPCFASWPGADWQATTWRITGNAWWERPGDGSAFSGLGAIGVTTKASSRAQDYTDAADCTNPLRGMSNNPCPSLSETQMPWEAARIAHVVAERLPTLRFKHDFGSANCAGVVDPNCPFQGDPIMDADAQNLYYFLVGGVDADATPQPGGLYKAPIPTAGTLPVWSSLGVAQPTGTPNGLTVTRRRLWIGIGEADGDNGLRHYAKNGSDPKFIPVPAGVFSVTQGLHQRWRS